MSKELMSVFNKDLNKWTIEDMEEALKFRPFTGVPRGTSSQLRATEIEDIETQQKLRAMQQKEYEELRREAVPNFFSKEFIEGVNYNPLAYFVIHALQAGASPYEVIEHLINSIDTAKAEVENLANENAVLNRIKLYNLQKW